MKKHYNRKKSSSTLETATIMNIHMLGGNKRIKMPRTTNNEKRNKTKQAFFKSNTKWKKNNDENASIIYVCLDSSQHTTRFRFLRFFFCRRVLSIAISLLWIFLNKIINRDLFVNIIFQSPASVQCCAWKKIEKPQKIEHVAQPLWLRLTVFISIYFFLNRIHAKSTHTLLLPILI